MHQALAQPCSPHYSKIYSRHAYKGLYLVGNCVASISYRCLAVQEQLREIMPALAQPLTPPRLAYAVLEPYRLFSDITHMVFRHPLINNISNGDGHTVMVLPGFLGNDSSTTALRHYINRWGYDAQPWELGRNLGPRRGSTDIEALLRDRLDTLYKQSGQKVSLVGWSLGGVLSRELARSCPAKVRQVISLGSPYGGDPKKSTSIWRLFERVTELPLDGELMQSLLERSRQPVKKVPCTSIYSRSDGIVSWQVAREKPGRLSENIRVKASHIGLGFSPSVMVAIADRLAQDPKNWQPMSQRIADF